MMYLLLNRRTKIIQRNFVENNRAEPIECRAIGSELSTCKLSVLEQTVNGVLILVSLAGGSNVG